MSDIKIERIDSTWVSHKFSDGSSHVSQSLVTSEKKPESSRKMSPPKWPRRELAMEYANAILGKGITSLPGLGIVEESLEIFTTGSKFIFCRSCQTKNLFFFDNCKQCGLVLTQPMNMHSSIEYEDGVWRVSMGRDITQSMKVNRRLKTVSANYNLPKDVIDASHVTMANLCYLLAPVAFVRVQKLDPARFFIAQWRQFGDKTCTKYAKALAIRYGGLVHVI